jgi:hypothetical protein
MYQLSRFRCMEDGSGVKYFLPGAIVLSIGMITEPGTHSPRFTGMLVGTPTVSRCLDLGHFRVPLYRIMSKTMGRNIGNR